tara:strand:+ start:229 stop:1167 length:939 start_codon:yes stop_codon:yes gene_type:complete
MYKFNCNCCLYKTNLKGDFKRHLKSNKHKRNIENTNQEINIDEILLKEYTKGAQKVQKGAILTKKGAQKVHKRYTNETNDLKVNINHNKNICEYCNKTFQSRNSMRRHIRLYCKVLKNKRIKEEEKLKELKNIITDEIDNQNCKITKLIDKLNTTNNTMNNSGNYNISNSHNQVNNIQLNIFGKEDLSMLTEKVKQELIKGPFKMMPKLMEMIYFNKDHPENHTMKLVNKKEKIMKIYNKEGWKYVDKDETIDYILEDKNYTVDSYYDTNEVQFSKFVKKTYGRFRELFDSRDDFLWNKIKREIDLVLWNNM